MSPIGRVFIVLNLCLAVGFVVTSGQLLQNQHKYKQLLTEEKATSKEVAEKVAMQISQLEKERNKFEVASSTNQESADAARLALGREQDDNKRLGKLTGEQQEDLKALRALAEAANTQSKSAFADSRKAYEASMAAISARDEAVNSKNSSDGENRNLKNEIAGLNETIGKKDLRIASLDRDNQEKNLLVAAAQANGFINAMAAPDLAGTVTNASGRLCTISIGENPGNVDIQSVISRMPFRFAIYDDNGFKAEAVATKYEASANAVLCNLMFTKGEATIRTGDKASTKP
ncbi:MAG: cell division protein FtsL [Planctomycetota bacterium]|jgi:cell division protein FtsL